MKRIAVLASGRGSNFEAIARNVREGRLEAEIAALVVNQPEARALEIARQYGIRAISLPSKGIDSDSYAAMVRDALAPLSVDLICLAGFMRRVGAPLLQAYPMRILNIHPSLLPAFPGLNVQQQAIDYGVKASTPGPSWRKPWSPCLTMTLPKRWRRAFWPKSTASTARPLPWC
jgi:phosphoribosylglycinamide formyltransferase-1